MNNTLEVKAVLRKAVSLAELDDSSLDTLAAEARELRLGSGDILFREHDPGDAVYVVLAGEIEIFVDTNDGEPLVLSRLSAGELFGEHYLLGGQSGLRNAGARSLTDCRLGVIAAERFVEVLHRAPQLARQLTERRNRLSSENLARRSAVFRELQRAAPDDPTITLQLPAGRMVFSEGDPADAAYLVVSGTLEVFQGGELDAPIARIGSGQCFGEQACASDAPRSASVITTSEVRLIAIPRAAFLRLMEQSDEVRQLVDGLDFLYRLPTRGVALVYAGKQAGEQSVERLYQLDDGRRFISSYLPAHGIFRMLRLDEAGPTRSFSWQSAVPDSAELSRSLKVSAEGDILAVYSVGPWPELTDLLPSIIDGMRFDDALLRQFEQTGTLDDQSEAQPAGRDIACPCLEVSVGQILCLRDRGFDTLAKIQGRTGCGSVCGSCETHVLELLGKAEWIPVRAEAHEVTESIRGFTLTPLRPVPIEWRAGQSIALSGRIDGRWVTRQYTVISTPASGVLEIAVRREAEGRFSRWLHEGKLRDKSLRIGAPRGVAWAGGETVCFVADIGVVLALAIARQFATTGEGRVHVEYSGEHLAEMAYVSDLGALSVEQPEFSLGVRTSTPPDELDEARIREIVAEFPAAEYVLCGTADYMRFVRDALQAAGVVSDRIREEVFSPPVARSADRSL